MNAKPIINPRRGSGSPPLSAFCRHDTGTAERDEQGKPIVGDYISKMVRLLESRAHAAGVTREEYLEGMIRGKYPQIYSREIDQFRETDGEAA